MGGMGRRRKAARERNARRSRGRRADTRVSWHERWLLARSMPLCVCEEARSRATPARVATSASRVPSPTLLDLPKNLRYLDSGRNGLDGLDPSSKTRKRAILAIFYI